MALQNINGHPMVKRLDSFQEHMRETLNHPIVKTEETAKGVMEGLAKIAALSGDQRAELLQESFEDLAKADDKVRLSIAYLLKSQSLLNDTILGLAFSNPFGREIIEKTYHLDGTRDADRTTLRISNAIDLGNEVPLDLGWMLNFSRVDARNYQDVEVMDLQGQFQWYEVPKPSVMPPSNSLKGPKSDKITPRYFNCLFDWDEQEMRFSLYNVNRILSMMRAGALDNKTRGGYREIFRFGTGAGYVTYDADGLFAETVSSTKEAFNQYSMRLAHALNQAHHKMIDRALGNVKGGKKTKHEEAPLRVTAQDTLVFYYNHAHFTHINGLNSIRPGEDGTNVRLTKNIAFVGTAYAPISGGWSISGETTTTSYDENKFFGSIKEFGDVDGLAGMLTIPQRRNNYPIFRDIVMISERLPGAEVSKLVAKQAYNLRCDDRQKARIDIGTLSAVS